MDAVAKAKRIVVQAADLVTALRLGRDRLLLERAKGRRAGVEARALKQPSLHDLMPLDLAALIIFRRVYAERMPANATTRVNAHLDGLAYTIAELAPVYVYEENASSVRLVSQGELQGGLFQGGAKFISYIDGRPGLKNLAVNAKHVESVIQTLIASSSVG
jgi:hypothetical protein